MNRFLLLLTSMVTLTICSQVYADTHVKGYTRSNGTYVQSHYRSVKTDITTITGALKETLILIPESLALKTDGKERH